MPDEEKKKNGEERPDEIEIEGNVERSIIGSNIDGGEIVMGDKVAGDKVEGDKVAGDKVEGDKISISGGGVVFGGDANIEGSVVAGRDAYVAGRDQYNIESVGPGSAIGPGATVSAQNIAGQNIVYGGINTNQIELGELKAAVEFLLDTANNIPDPELRGKANFYIHKMEKALELDAPEGANPNLTTFQKAADWLLDTVPELADDVLDLLGLPVIGKIAKVAGKAFADWLKNRLSMSG